MAPASCNLVARVATTSATYGYWVTPAAVAVSGFRIRISYVLAELAVRHHLAIKPAYARLDTRFSLATA
jgi:hypothetical protein